MAVILNMNATRQKIFRDRLADLLRDVERQDQRGQDGQRIVALDQQSVGRLSRMDAMQQQEMAKATQLRRNQLKIRIAAALARLEQGEFGYCIQCGDKIAKLRLENDPTVASCLACASA